MYNRLLMGALCAFFAVNALWFAASAAIPLPSSDAWFFIDTFVRHAVDGDLSVKDFFTQRFAGDHAQPIHRLVLLAHMAFADLDFRVEALIGISLSVVTCAVLAHLLLSRSASPVQLRRAWWAAAGIFAVGLSLNSTNLYTWSLVSLAWISLLAIILYWLLAAQRRSPVAYVAQMAFATLALGLIADELALPAVAAAVVAVSIRDGVRAPREALILLCAGVLGLLLARTFVHSMAGVAADATPGSLSKLLGVLSRPEAWKLLVGPLADSLVHQEHLAARIPGWTTQLQVLIAVVLAAAHLLFWWQVLVRRRDLDGPVLVMAISCMLFFYASIGGIALSRVPEFGVEYVHQPRYVVVYALNVIALLLVFLGARREYPASSPRTPVIAWAGPAMATAVILLQGPLTYFAWQHAPFVRKYSEGAAAALMELARTPSAEPAPPCPPTLTVCKAPPERRERIMSLLREHRLSIYSARFRARHGLEALALTAGLSTGSRQGNAGGFESRPTPAQARQGDCRVDVLKRGPQAIVRNVPFNRQANGQSAFWLAVADDTPEFAIDFEGRPVRMTRRAGTVTYLHDERQVEAVAAGRPLRFNIRCAGDVVASFNVEVR